MKRIIAVLLMLLAGIGLMGCTAAEQTSGDTKIQKVTIRYTVDGENYRSIKADFSLNEKTVTDSIGSASEKTTRKLAEPEKLLDFLAGTVIPAINSEAVQTEDNAEMQIIWYIQIDTDHGRLREEGFENETYPDYWEELLRYLEP